MERLLLSRLLALALLAAPALSSCSTGTDTADTNVEKGTSKDFTEQSPTKANGNTTASDSATAGLQRDTSGNPTGRQQYEDASEARDRNRDGIAD